MFRSLTLTPTLRLSARKERRGAGTIVLARSSVSQAAKGSGVPSLPSGYPLVTPGRQAIGQG